MGSSLSRESHESHTTDLSHSHKKATRRSRHSLTGRISAKLSRSSGKSRRCEQSLSSVAVNPRQTNTGAQLPRDLETPPSSTGIIQDISKSNRAAETSSTKHVGSRIEATTDYTKPRSLAVSTSSDNLEHHTTRLPQACSSLIEPIPFPVTTNTALQSPIQEHFPEKDITTDLIDEGNKAVPVRRKSSFWGRATNFLHTPVHSRESSIDSNYTNYSAARSTEPGDGDPAALIICDELYKLVGDHMVEIKEPFNHFRRRFKRKKPQIVDAFEEYKDSSVFDVLIKINEVRFALHHVGSLHSDGESNLSLRVLFRPRAATNLFSSEINRTLVIIYDDTKLLLEANLRVAKGAKQWKDQSNIEACAEALTVLVARLDKVRQIAERR
jgi:hypothetical protein